MITKSFLSNLKTFDASDLTFFQGLEKEGLRVNRDLDFSDEIHSEKLGHKLTHPYITTDYAENLLEFITPVFSDTTKLLAFLTDIHKFAYEHLEDELIWPGSFPSKISDEREISIADYGDSNSGKLKTLYRVGLGHRYGKSMQSIAGLHYNFSFSKELISKLYSTSDHSYKSERAFTNGIYFKLIRNYRRYSWLLSYLFGATPAVDKSFLKNKKHNLTDHGKNTSVNKTATSLRMGGLGYTSSAQEKIYLCYNQLSTYIKTLESARLESHPQYEAIGLQDAVGNLKQLNTNLLQIDNEFYTHIRPKRVAKSGESALMALDKRGIEYIEVRLLDLDPFSALGTDKESLDFIQMFLLFCMLSESKSISKDECNECGDNYNVVVVHGRDENAELTIHGEKIALKDYAHKIIKDMQNMIGENDYLSRFESSIQIQEDKVFDQKLLTSSKILSLLNEDVGYLELMQNLSLHHKVHFEEAGYSEISDVELVAIAHKSHKQEKKILANDDTSFKQFLIKYFEQIKIKE